MFNNKLKCFLFFFIFIFLCSFVVANNNYTVTGTVNDDFVLGDGFFNSDLEEVGSSTRVLNRPRQTPLVADLDNDNVNEIIVYDDEVIRLYTGSDLTIVDAFNLPFSDGLFSSNMIVFDIDGDDFSEIIIADEIKEGLYILEYNGTDFYQQNNISLNGLTHEINDVNYDVGEMLIRCGDTENCLLAHNRHSNVKTGQVNGLYATFFNSTAITTPFNLSGGTGGDYKFYCFSQIPIISYSDYDNDDDVEYIITSFVGNYGSTDAAVNIFYVGLNGSNDAIEELEISDSDLVDFGVALSTENCNETGIFNKFTSAFVWNIDGSVSNGEESVIGLAIDSNEFVMHSFLSSGGALDDYPEVFEADGELISNVFLMNAFTDTNREDFCVLGYQQTNGEIDLLCASEITGEVPETVEFNYDVSYNVSRNYRNYNSIVHSARHSSDLEDGVNLDELVCPYGIFSLDYTGDNELELVYESPQVNGNVLSIDVEKIGRDDLLILTNSNLWYYDDEFANQNAELYRITTNPSIESVIQVNETVHLTVQAIDEEGDNVQVKVIAYEGHINQQNSNWTTFSSSGAVFPLTFEANVTIGVGNLVFYARDSLHNESVNTTYTFSVGNVGAVYGDSIFDSGVLTEEEDGEDSENNNTATDNTARTLTQGLASDVGIDNVTLLVIILVVAIIICMVIFGHEGHLKLGVGVGIIFDILVLLLFTVWELVSPAYFISLLFIFIVVAVIYVVSRLKKDE